MLASDTSPETPAEDIPVAATPSCATCKFFYLKDSSCRISAPSAQAMQQICVTRTKMWGDHDGSDATAKTDFGYKAVWPEVSENDWCGEHEAKKEDEEGGLFASLLELLPMLLPIILGKDGEMPSEPKTAPDGAGDPSQSQSPAGPPAEGTEGAGAAEASPSAASASEPERDLMSLLLEIAAHGPHAEAEKDQAPMSPETLAQLAQLIPMVSIFLRPKKPKSPDVARPSAPEAPAPVEEK